MNFLVDQQLPPALARFVSQDLGANSKHVFDVDLQESSDNEVWRFASAHSFIVVSKDEDFVTLFTKQPTTRLLWVRLGNCRTTRLLEVFRHTWPRIAMRFASGEQLIELR